MWWLILCVNLARLSCPVVSSSASTVVVFESICGWDKYWQSVNGTYSRLSSVMWVDLIQSTEGHKGKNWDFHIKSQFFFETATCKSCLNFQPTGSPYRFWAQLCNINSYLNFQASRLPFGFGITIMWANSLKYISL